MNDGRLSPEYTAWRNAVIKRDKHKCQFPDCKRKKYLEVHHIFTWAHAPYLRYEVSNGICLCKKHHRSIKNKETTYAELFVIIVGQNVKSNNNSRH